MKQQLRLRRVGLNALSLFLLLFTVQVASAQLTVSISAQTDVLCNGASTGALTASVSGGTPNYSYSWSNGSTTVNTSSTTNSISSLVAGVYKVVVTDNLGAKDSVTTTITEPAALAVALSVDSNESCGGAMDGGLTATPSGGVGPYSYSWSNGASTASISGVGAGTYTVTITDDNGCSLVDSGTVGSDDVTPPTALAFNITSYFNNGPGIATLSGYNLFTFGPTTVNLPFNDPIPLGAEIQRVEVIVNVNYPLGTGTATNEVYIGGTLIGSTTVGGGAGDKSYTLTYDTVPPGFVYGGSNTFQLTSTVNPVYFKSTSIRLYYRQPNCEAYAFVPPLIAFDNCAVATVVNDYNGTSDAADIYPIGVTTVNWTVTDNSGNTTNTSQTVTVIDNEKPEAYARDLTVYLDATGSATITAAQVDSGSTDVCGIDTLTLSKYTFGCLDTGANNITLTALDPHGNSENASAVITVLDTMGPTAVTQNITAYLDSNGLVSITAADLDNGSYDNCGIDTIILSQYDFDCSHAGVQGVSFKAYDDNGFVDSVVVNVTIADTINPTPVAQNLTVYLDATGMASITAADVDHGSTDNCAIDTMILSQYDFDCSHVGFNATTLRAYDSSGNVDSALALIMVIDTIKPAVAVQNINVYLDAAGVATVTAADVDNGTADACGIDTLILSQYDFDCSHVGANVVTFTATDSYGNTDSATATLTVIDTVSPALMVQNLTIYLDATGAASITVADADNGTTDACGIDTLILSQYDFDCSHVGANSITFTANDINANSASTLFTVTVLDTINPTPVAQNLTVYLDATGMASISAADVDNGSSDNCAIDTLILSQYDFDCSHVGFNATTLRVYDSSGNVDSALALIMVIDTIKPAVAVQNINVYLDAAGVATVTAADVDNGTADACGIDTLILSQYDFDCSHVGANVVTFTATDSYGNTDSATATLTVIDTVSPALMVQNLTIYLDATGAASITAADADNGTTDACGIDTLILSQYDFDCSHVGANSITFTANDINANSASTLFTVTVLDTINPTPVAQNLTVYLDATGMASITAADVDHGSTDNCAIDTMILSQYDFDCSHVGFNATTLRAYDSSGNVDSALALIMVIDTLDPTAVAQNLTVYLDASGSASITAADADNGSADICGIDTLILSQYDFDCSHIGSNTVSFTANDVFGNSSTTTFNVDVLDTISTTLATQNVTAYLDAAGMVSITAADADNGTADACGIDTLILSQYDFDCSHVGVNTITFTALDVNGNSISTTVDVTVMDTVSPAPVAQNLTVYLDAAGMASITAADAENGTTDACGIDTLILSQYDFDCSHTGNNTISFIANDINGNSTTITFDVTVLDTLKPVAMAQNVTVYLDAAGTASITAIDADNGSSDICGIDTLTLSQYDFDCSHVGLNPVTFKVYDNSGNVDSALTLVMVIDTIKPTVAVQNISVSLTSGGVANITPADLDNGSFDACGIDTIILSNYSFTCLDAGPNTVSFTASDAFGNTSMATATVTIIDTAQPAVLTQNDTVYVDLAGLASITLGDVVMGATAGCGIDTIFLDKYNFTCADIGTDTVTVTATSLGGAVSNVPVYVTIMDTISPKARTKNITVYLDQNGTTGITPASVNHGSVDFCGYTLTLSQTSFDCSETGLNLVKFWITDKDNNQDSSDVLITVKDTISPKLHLVNKLTVTLDQFGNATIAPNQLDSASTDNCANLLFYTASKTQFTCADLGTNVVTVTVYDNKNNSTTGTAIVEVKDMMAPVVNTVNSTVFLDASGQASIATAQVNNGTIDNCGIDSLWLDKTSFSCTNIGQNTVKLYAKDGSGNTAQSNAVITVMDTIKPVLSAVPATITAYTQAGQCVTNVQWPTITATDNCSASVSTSRSNGSLFQKGTTAVQVIAADVNGNTVVQSFNVVVMDTISPIVSNVPVSFNVAANAATCDAQVNWNEPIATDNCGNVTWTKSHQPGSVFSVGSTTVTYTATDADNNSTTVSFVVVVTDNVAPVLSNIPADIIASADAGSCDAVVNYTMPTVSDNCSSPVLTSSHASGSVFPAGVTTVTLTATDAGNNVTTATFTVTVEDNEKPVITSMPANDTVGVCGSAYTYSKPVATDNCSNVTVTQISGLASGSMYPTGVTVNTFHISDASGNDTTVSFAVVVVPQGLPSLPNTLELCQEDEAVDLALGQNIVWTGQGMVNAQTFNPSVAGIGRHKLDYVFTDNIGCSTSGTIYITVQPQPAKPVVNKIGSHTLGTAYHTSYQWYRDGVLIPGATAQNYQYTLGGNYQVVVGNASGCNNHSDGFVVGQAGGGIGLEESALGNLALYPNPTDGMLMIDLNFEQEQDLEIAVFNLTGKKVMELKDITSAQGKLSIDLSHLPDATYMVRTLSNEESVVKRVVVY